MGIAQPPAADLPLTAGRPVAANRPPPMTLGLVARIAEDIRRERRIRRRASLPPGSTAPSWQNTKRIISDPLGLLLEHRQRFGPVFTIRLLHEPIVWAIGPEANHQILVADFDAFQWREGRFADLWPLLGDGLLNTDGAYHREFRMLLLPAFHRERIASLSESIVREAVDAAQSLADGQVIDIYRWVRELALRIALRVLLGVRTTRERERELATTFETSLAIHGEPVPLQMLPGPGTPLSRAIQARRRLEGAMRAEIEARRRSGEPGPGVLGLLLSATDADGRPLGLRTVRDHAITLLFAGHDTTTTTFTFLTHELGRNPALREGVERELERVLGPREVAAAELDGEALPLLERCIKETLRRYPAAWVGPRRATRDVTLAGVTVPAEVAVHYSSWATHHLPELYPDPFRFDPDRFSPEREAALPRGAYVPFGGGSRMCLGKRFGEYELRALAAVLYRRVRLEPVDAREPAIATTPTLGPRGGLRFTVRTR
ncbi:MAG TPA: cytochrome P450 [Solirubrobacteraceae bacterium]|nr:cytochrome P450 [Solirubrobacteraceae bacterium]